MTNHDKDQVITVKVAFWKRYRYFQDRDCDHDNRSADSHSTCCRP